MSDGAVMDPHIDPGGLNRLKVYPGLLRPGSLMGLDRRQWSWVLGAVALGFCICELVGLGRMEQAAVMLGLGIGAPIAVDRYGMVDLRIAAQHSVLTSHAQVKR